MMLSCKQHTAKVLAVLSKTRPANNYVLYLAGEETKQRPYTDRDLSFKQESNFFYLTGCEIPSAKLVVKGNKDGFESTLFVPPLNPDEVMWMGLPPTTEHVAKTHDVTSVKTTDQLDEELKSASAAASHSPVLTLTGVKLGSMDYDDTILLDAIEEARLTKTDSELERIAKANELSSKAHEHLIRHVRELKSEFEAGALFEYRCKHEGSRHQAYESIMASGPSSATLHYVDNRQPFKDDQSGLILVDAGCEFENYAADITRTFPLNGTFTPEARNIYNLVFDMQSTAFGMIKAGASWEGIHLKMHEMVVRGLLKIGILIAGPSKATGEELVTELYEKNLSCPFFPHGLGHNLGLDVHDVPGKASKPQGPSSDPKLRYLRILRPLVENQVVTVEPGTYFNPFLLEPVKDSPYINHELVKDYIKIGGVRLEDDVIVTKTGYKNLTTVPRTIEEIEKMAAGLS